MSCLYLLLTGAEDFQFIDIETNDNSFITRGFLKLYHQYGVQFKDENWNIKFFFVESLSYNQIGNAYLDFEIQVKKR